jgi:hypothetical protein
LGPNNPDQAADRPRTPNDFFQIPVFVPVGHDMLESYSILAYLAGRSERIELGALVTGVTPGTRGCWSRP